MNFAQKLKDVGSIDKLKSAPFEYLVGFVIFTASLILLFDTNWKIAVGVIAFQWSQNIHDGIKYGG